MDGKNRRHTRNRVSCPTATLQPTKEQFLRILVCGKLCLGASLELCMWTNIAKPTPNVETAPMEVPVHCARTSTLILLLTLVVLSIPCLPQSPSDYRAGSLVKQEPQSIYAADPHDSWNRIFYLLFTRTTEFRLTDDFKEAGPFAPSAAMRNPALPVSSRTFERIEGGDRSIDPLYPNFLSSKGAEAVLADPQFTEFKQALKDAGAEPTPRSPTSRFMSSPAIRRRARKS